MLSACASRKSTVRYAYKPLDDRKRVSLKKGHSVPIYLSKKLTEDVSIISGEDYEGVEGDVKSGLLTAGEINDFSKWELWQDISTTDLESYISLWKFHPKERYCVQLSGYPRKVGQL